MPSTYTNLGIEKIGVGEQSGVWGDTTNTNFDILDQAISGIVNYTLTGDVTLSLSDGATSDARNFVLKFSSALSSTVNVTIGPNDVEKTYIIHNTTSHPVVMKQGGGTGSTVTVVAGGFKLIYCDGTGANANVVDVLLTSQGGITWNDVITSNTTAVSGNGYFIDTTSSTVTLTLPASPELGDIVRVIDLGNAATNNITIGRNSEKIMGDASDMTVNTDNAAFGLVYSGSTHGWRLLEV